METENTHRKQGKLPPLEHQIPGLPGKDAFQVPEGYFEALPGKVMERIAREKPAITIDRYTKRNVFRKFALPLAAASLLLFFTIAEIQHLQSVRKNNRLTEAQVTGTQKENDFYPLDEESFTEFISEHDLKPATEMITSDTTITKESIIDYLSQAELDESLLADI